MIHEVKIALLFCKFMVASGTGAALIALTAYETVAWLERRKWI